MDDEILNTLSLDLILGPDPEISLESVMTTAAFDLTDPANIVPVLNETHRPARRLRQLLISSANGATLPPGEGSLTSRARVNKDSEKCENGDIVMEEDNVTEEKNVNEKSIGRDRSFFDCCICLELCKEPVVTTCGHLYCWSCIYNWLKHSVVKNCPVCKGEVSVEALTPIYGHGENKRESEEDLDINIPLRPQARRVDSLRIALERSGYRHFQGTLARGYSTRERRNRFMNSRGVREEENQSSEPLVSGESGNLRNHQEEDNIVTSVDVEERDSFSSIVGVVNSESQGDTWAEIGSMLNVSSKRRRDENGSRVSQGDNADSYTQRRTRRRLA